MIEGMTITYYAGQPVDAFIRRCGYSALYDASHGGKTPVLLIYRGADLVLVLPYDDMWDRWYRRNHIRALNLEQGAYVHFMKIVERYVSRRLRCL